MAYEKQNFVDGQVLTANQLNHMEDGIEAAFGSGGGGGGEVWEDIVDITTTEEVTQLSITTDKDGNPFELVAADIAIFVQETPTNSSDAALSIRTNVDSNAKGGTNTSATRMFRGGTGTCKTALTLNCRSAGIKGAIYNIGNTPSSTAGYYNEIFNTFTALFLFGGTFGIGSRVIIKGVRT